MNFTWSDAATHQADFCRRAHLRGRDRRQIARRAERVAESLGVTRITIPTVQEACRLIQNERATADAHTKGGVR